MKSSALTYTLIALFAFAGNSILCRLALANFEIDPASFTSIRLLSGAITLFFLWWVMFDTEPKKPHKFKRLMQYGSWTGAFYLASYAIGFSYAYMSLDTGTGALILFASVQITMVTLSYFTGSRLNPVEWGGLILALTGFIYLVLPTLSTPSWIGFVLMSLSGIAWGLYTLNGRSSLAPIADTASNFIRTLPCILFIIVWQLPNIHFTQEGIVFALLSGVLASGIGYGVWYFALGLIRSSVAAVSQLLVPMIAAVGGVIFVGEHLTLSLIVASFLIVMGVLGVVLGARITPKL